MRRGLALALLVAAVVAPASAARKPSAFARTVSCKMGDVTIMFDGKSVVVEGHHQTLGRATQLALSVAKTCVRLHHFGIARQLLDHNNPPGRRTQIVCRIGAPTIIEVEPVRNDAYRIIGSRLAVWQDGFLGEVAEAMIVRRSNWFSWTSAACHPA